MRRFLVALLTVVALAACGASPGATPASTASSGPVASAVASARASAAPATATPVLSFKAGAWPPAWQRWICSARAQLLREDAQQGGRPGGDAASRAIDDLRQAPNWDPGADFRSLLGKAGFVMLDASPRGGDALKDIVAANAAFEAAYEALKAATGFECPS